MVSMNPNPAQAQGFYSDSSSAMPLPGLNPLSAGASAPTNGAVVPAAEDPSKKVRKPYTITKSRESWTEPEHDKFLEALQLFDRDWKKIEAFVGSKTVIQIRSHAQKYFLKVQKSGSNEHVPPPRPKRKAAHPYPQKASMNVSQAAGSYQFASTVREPGHVYRPDSSSMLMDQPANAPMPSSWTYNTVTRATAQPLRVRKALAEPAVVPAGVGCCSSSTVGTPSTLPAGGASGQGNLMKPTEVIPDFAKVYRFIGSVFDPDTCDHLQRLKKMDPINIETALLLMRNLSVNLMSPEFEDQRKLLFSSYDVESGRARSCNPVTPTADSNSKTAIAAI